MEISRRRHQIEENSRLHEELIRLAKLRETAELGECEFGGFLSINRSISLSMYSYLSRYIFYLMDESSSKLRKTAEIVEWGFYPLVG